MCVFNAQVHVCLWVQCRSPKGCCSTRRQLLFPVQIVKKNVIENVVPIIVATKHLVSTCTVYWHVTTTCRTVSCTCTPSVLPCGTVNTVLYSVLCTVNTVLHSVLCTVNTVLYVTRLVLSAHVNTVLHSVLCRLAAC